MGRSDHDLGTNLHGRAERIATAAGVPAPDGAGGERRLGVPEYLRFVAAHPGGALRASAADLAVFGAESGAAYAARDYLGVAPREAAGDAIASAAEAAAFAAFMALALAGALAWVRDPDEAPDGTLYRLRVLCALFPLYVFASTQAVDAAQSRHRAPAEALLCLLAAAGVPALRRMLSARGALGAVQP